MLGWAATVTEAFGAESSAGVGRCANSCKGAPINSGLGGSKRPFGSIARWMCLAGNDPDARLAPAAGGPLIFNRFYPEVKRTDCRNRNGDRPKKIKAVEERHVGEVAALA